MNYAIRKPKPDQRHNTCGFALEDNTVVVTPYRRSTTKEVARNQALEDRLKRVEEFGYLVEETEVEPGTYSEAEYFAKAETKAKRGK